MAEKKEVKPKFFATSSAFRKWLEKNHDSSAELLVGYYKVGSGKPSMGWSDSVDEALCFGWIDGVRKSLGEESYTIRFCPRRKNSIWSAINIRKVGQLIKEGKMQKAGLKVFEERNKSKAMVYSHENTPKELSPSYLKKFKANKKAWEFFNQMAPSHRKVIIHWIMSAKKEETQKSRLGRAIQSCEAHEKL